MTKISTMNTEESRQQYVDFVHIFVKQNGRKLEDGLYRFRDVLMGKEFEWILRQSLVPYTIKGKWVYVVTDMGR